MTDNEDTNPRCPLCNGIPATNDFDQAQDEPVRVYCMGCGLSTGPHDTDADAWDQWGKIAALKTTMSAPRVNQLDDFTRGFISGLHFTLDEANLFDNPDIPLKSAALLCIIADCTLFQRRHASLLNEACACRGYDLTRAGRDFWHARQNTGIGMWLKDIGYTGMQLIDAARTFPKLHVFIRDGLIDIQ